MASPEDMREITQQFKENTEDLQAFLRDLEGWKKEMEVKDRQLLKAKTQTVASACTTNDKKAVAAPQKRKELKHAVTDPEKPERKKKIKFNEYDKWDKFDVDKALQEIDDVDQDEEDSEDEDEEVTVARLMQQALVEKERGNEFFKEGNFDQAINCYTRGIHCDPTNAALPSNRAMALIKKGQFAAAETDCTIAVDLDPTYSKAFQRRATARAKLNKIDEAIQDYETVISLDPANKSAHTELKRLHKVRESRVKSSNAVKESVSSFGRNIRAAFSEQKRDNGTKPQGSDDLEVGQILPLIKPRNERSRKPLRRIEIVEVGDKAGEATASNSGDLGPPPTSFASTGIEEPNVPDAAKNKTEENGHPLSAPVDPTALEQTPPPQKASLEETVLVKPNNSSQFLTTWKVLSDKKKRDFLDQLEPTDYTNVFKQSLEPSILGDIITCLATHPEPERAVEHLRGLSLIPRISAVVLFMDQNAKTCIKQILDKAVVASGVDAETVSCLLQVYEIS